MTKQEVMTQYLLAFIQGLKQAGVTQAVISPGSRSTPLALLLYRDTEIATQIIVDERSAGFFAVGLAKAQSGPIALVCTSGTAAANYYPAICEAQESNLSLVVLTTDRPPELRDVGAPQAMNQQDLYSHHVKKFVELSVPEAGEEMLRYSYWQALTASLFATEQPRGPVQINLPLREPLLPVAVELEENFSTETYLPVAAEFHWPDEQLAHFLEKRGLIVVGDEQSPLEARTLLKLAERLNWPIVGDPITNLANCGISSENYLKHADLIFAIDGVEQPEVVLRFGKLPLTKNLMLYLKNLSKETIWLFVDEHRQKKDQLQRTNFFIPMAIADFSATVQRLSIVATEKNWLASFIKKEQRAKRAVKQVFLNTKFSESQASQLLFEMLQKNDQLLLANSNAIRFVDRFGQTSAQSYHLFGNRGVNGIDGLISTAAGIAANHQQTYLLIGDLAFFHDMNGLQVIRQAGLDVVIVLLNNNGGGIFSFLSQNQLPEDEFLALFGTPLNLNFAQAAALYDAGFHSVNSAKEFQLALQKTRQQGLQIIEVTGTQQAAVDLWQKVIATYRDQEQLDD